MRLYAMRDERDGTVHLASGDDPVGLMLCGADLARWYPVKAENVSSSLVCTRCVLRRRTEYEAERGRRVAGR